MFEILSNSVKPKAGRILLSEPFSSDYYFSRSALLLIDFDATGCFGVVLNKALKINASEAITDFPVCDIPVSLGGPVETNRVFFLHSLGNVIPGSLQIKQGLFWGGDFNRLRELASEGIANASNTRIFIGYAGWGKNQLNEELERNAWAVIDFEPNQIFNTPMNILWKKLVNNLGKEYSFWQFLPTNPSLN